MQLDPAAIAAGVRLLVRASIASTNAEALALARGGERGPLWIVARQQTAGRGRRGNPWVSEPGNLFATLLLERPARDARAPQLSFVAALAVHDAILAGAGSLQARLTLKWPNDVLCDARKVAGILIEGETGVDRLAVAVGIGVNCTSHPDRTSYPSTDLAHAGAPVSTEVLFAALSAAMVRRTAQWRGGEGFAAIRADWLARAGGLGAYLRVRLADRTLAGRFEGLDTQGRLVLRQPEGGLQTISAGEVFQIGPASSAVLHASGEPQ
jgi:BirA family biotin operon repressor/biotin-[acetyl-CoA-carboxylase] ligase